jgi:hypothetical protein
MDALQDIFLSLASLSHLELMVGLLITGTVIIVFEDWRLSLWALLAQYVLVSLLLVRVMPLRVALIKVIVGGMVCVILYLTARRVHWGRESAAGEGYYDLPSVAALFDVFPMNVWFRLLVAVLAAVVTHALGTKYPFVDEPLGISQACYWLVAIGLLVVILARDPFKVGIGLLTFQAGFEVLFATLEKSLSVAALLGAISLLVALAVSYLTTAQISHSAEDGKR